jgi:predicted ATPase
MRVGVVTGEVAVTVGATAEGMVAGDAVNTASRVQSVAEPGQVWVDDTTRSLTLAAITYQDAGAHTVKGKAEPIHLYAARAVVAEVGGAQRVDGLEAPLAGRDRELRLIKELFHATEESQRPRLVVVDGEAGVGKSRLGWEFQKYVDGLTATVRWHRGRCLSYGDGVAFWALAEAVRARLGLSESDTGDLVTSRLEEALLTYLPDEAERDWVRPRLAGLIGAGPGTGFARQDLFAAWTTFFESLSEGQHAVVLVIDDAQHADDGLLDFFDHLLATAHAGIFVLALARPELLARRNDIGGRRATAIRLDPLDPGAMNSLIDGLVVGLPATVRRALVERAEGIPLFAVETVRALIDRDAVVPQGGRYVLADGAALDLQSIGAPASLQALVAARLDALTPAERRVVAHASVLGTSFTREGLAALSDEEDLDDVLAALVRKEILGIQTDRLSAERGQYRFVQGVVRQVAYSTQSRRDRKVRHLAAAEFLAAQPDDTGDLNVVIAQHLLDAVDASNADDDNIAELSRRASSLLERAADRARALGAPAEAQRLLEAALAHTEGAADYARLHLATASTAHDAGDFDGTIRHATQAEKLFNELGRPIDAGLATSHRALATGSLQDHARSIEIAEPAWRALQDVPGSGPALLALARTLAGAFAARGEYEQMGYYAERRILLAEALNDYEALTHAQLQVGIRYLSLGAPVTARTLYSGAAEIAREHDISSRLALALNNLASVSLSRDLAAALAYGREGIDAARRSGLVAQIDFTRLNYVLALWVAGRLAEASAGLEELQESVSEPAISCTLPAVDCWLSEALGRETLASYVGGLSSDAEPDLAWQGSFAVAAARAAGDRRGAAAAAERTMAHALTAQGFEDDFMHQWPPLVLAALEARDIGLAERLMEPVETAEAGIVPLAVRAQQRRLRGLVRAASGDDPLVVEAELRAGIEALDAFGAVGWVAQAQAELGRWLVNQGRLTDAEPLLDAARSTYKQIGALGWLAQLDDLQPSAAAR